MYKTNKPLKKDERVSYTAKQLQVVPENEDDPSPSVIRTPNAKGEYAIKKLIDKRVNGKTTSYLIWWKGYPKDQSSWQIKSKIPKSFISKYEDEN